MNTYNFTVKLTESVDGSKDGLNIYHFSLDSEYRSLSKSSYDTCLDNNGMWKNSYSKIKNALCNLLECTEGLITDFDINETNERITKGKTRKYEYKRVHEITFKFNNQTFKGYVSDCGIIR